MALCKTFITILTDPFPTMKRAKGSKSTPLCICPMAITKAIEAMRESDSGLFRFADNEAEGNLYYLESDGDHSGYYAMLYFYNGLRWIWR